MKRLMMIIGFVIMFGVAGRYDCDVAMGLASPSMIGWIIAGILLMAPEVIWFLYMMKKAKEVEE